MNINIINPPTELVRVSGKAAAHLLVCPNTESCDQQPATMWTTHCSL